MSTAAARLICPDFAGWHCKPVSDITGRIDQLACGSVLVLAWAPEQKAPISARLLYVKPEMVSWDNA